MAATGAYINQAELDEYNIVWAVGRSLNRFDGTSSEYYTNLNSAVPGNGPYFLDTRSISISENSTKWVGCAYSTQYPSTPLVFNVTGQYADSGKSWSPFDITGASNLDLEVPTIYSSPFGNEVLAFVSPLNGGFGTGPSGIGGITGGNLFVYNETFQTWTEPSPGFIWPHIYSIKAKGIDGFNFEYYIATSEGIWIIPPGDLEISELDGGIPYIVQAKIWNSKNTSLPSDTINSIDFDENGNLWIGTDNGLSYWDGSKFYVWNALNLPGLLSNKIYNVRSRPNGHVFFSAGNSSKFEGTGLYYFNGDTLINYTSGNSDLVSNDIFSVMLAERKSNSNGFTVFENDIFVASGNSVGLFNYTIPHIYASSKYTGTTGWNFVYYTPTTEAFSTDEAKLPKANKYTWDYPSWRNYQNFQLAYKHPGLDPRNLFLEADLKAISDGRAGNQNYWNLGQVPEFSSSQMEKSLQPTDWINGITGGVNTVTTSAYIGEKYVIGGYTSLDTTYFGQKNNLENLILPNPNPTSPYYSRSGQKTGYVAYYNESGQPQDLIPIRGYETEVWDIQPSPDQTSLYVLGMYKGYIESGELIWSSSYPGSSGLTGGPTGGPIGFSNVNSPGITGSPYEYPWIYDGTQILPATGPFLPATGPIDTNSEGLFLMEIEKNLGSQVSYGGINFGVTGEFGSSYRLKQFRSFPAVSSQYNPSSSSTSIDTQLYEKSFSLFTSEYSVSLVGTLEGGISTGKNPNNPGLDSPMSQEFVFSSGSSTYLKSGFVIDLGTEMQLLKTEVSSSTGGNVIFNSIQKDKGTSTYLITGSSDSGSFTFSGSLISGGSTGSTGPFYLIGNENSGVFTSSFIQTNSPLDDFRGIDSSLDDGKYFWTTIYTGTGSFGEKIIQSPPEYNGFNLLTVSLTPSESSVVSFSNEITNPINSSKIGIDGFKIGSSDQKYYSVFSEGPSASNEILKIDGKSNGISGNFKIGGTGHFSISLGNGEDLFIAGSREGETGPSEFPVSSSSVQTSFSALSKQFVSGRGIDLGNIISRAGSGAWTWADVHNSNEDIFVPLLSTVFFTNYASSIFGKQNNRWVLIDEFSGTVILDVKSIPYFIYTFTETGYYSIQNTVEDSNGNLYSVSKKAFVKVTNESIPRADDPNPEFVNSVDYGYPPVNPASNNQIFELSKDLIRQQAEISRENRKTFGSGLDISE